MPLSCLDTFLSFLTHALEKTSGAILSIPPAEPVTLTFAYKL